MGTQDMPSIPDYSSFQSEYVQPWFCIITDEDIPALKRSGVVVGRKMWGDVVSEYHVLMEQPDGSIKSTYVPAALVTNMPSNVTGLFVNLRLRASLLGDDQHGGAPRGDHST